MTHVRLACGTARVNWHREGLLGITFVDGLSKGLSNVIREDEVLEWIGGGPQLSELSEEQLREELRRIREARRAPKVPPRKAAAVSASHGPMSREEVLALIDAIKRRLEEAD